MNDSLDAVKRIASEIDAKVYKDPIQLILAERRRQDRKWGPDRNLSHLEWFTIMSEESGECAKSILETDFENLEKEIIQVAAVAVAWFECILRRKEE